MSGLRATGRPPPRGSVRQAASLQKRFEKLGVVPCHARASEAVVVDHRIQPVRLVTLPAGNDARQYLMRLSGVPIRCPNLQVQGNVLREDPGSQYCQTRRRHQRIPRAAPYKALRPFRDGGKCPANTVVYLVPDETCEKAKCLRYIVYSMVPTAGFEPATY